MLIHQGAEVKGPVLLVVQFSGVVPRHLSVPSKINASDSRGTTPLMAAAARADLRLCKLLLANGAAVNLEDGSGRSALSLGAYRGNVKLVRLLVDEGASVDIRSFDGRTPLFSAVEYNSPKVGGTLPGCL